MKKQLLLFLITILSLNCYSQISYEKGYYIDNSNQKVDCLIKNVDWKNNPTEFVYKLAENTSVQKATIKTIKEFGIYNKLKYERYTVNIDRSSNVVNNLSNVRKVLFNEEQLFLQVLIEGEASLYVFEDSNLIRYFYSKDQSKPKQLIFKKYVTFDNKIGTNNRFKQELWINLKCSGLSENVIENLDYTRSDLTRFFIKYNKCNNHEYTNFDKKEKKEFFNLSIRPGFNSSTLSIDNRNSSSRNTDFGNEIGFRLGIEAEFILPFNKNKWAIIIEPTYQYFKSEKESTYRSFNRHVKSDYKSIELPVGVRHYFFLNESSKVFINGSFVYDISFNSVIDFNYSKDLEINNGVNFAFGIGYKRNNKYSLELRYLTSRDVLNEYVSWDSQYKTLSVIFGYTLF